LGVETPGWQSAKTQEWLDIPSFHTVSRTGCTGGQNMTLFLNEPFVRGVSDRVCIGFHIKILECVIARRRMTYTTSSFCLAKIIIWKSI
jgi:hypothetical protein